MEPNLGIGIAIGVVTGLIVNFISPPFSKFVNSAFSWLFHFLNPEKFDLTGNWVQVFEEPTSENITVRQKITEKIKLKHIGSVITAEGVTDIDPRSFTYDCTIKHSMLFGEYVKKGEKGNISGSGMIQLIVSPDRLTMEGQTTWYDNDTKRIESSHAIWKKTV